MTEKLRHRSAAGVTTILVVIVLVIFQLLGGDEGGPSAGRTPGVVGSRLPAGEVGEHELGEQQILVAYRDMRSDVQVDVQAQVSRILADDLDGDKHQRFLILFSGSGHTVLVAHNIDLAPRVPISIKDWVRVVGEYEWSEQGGVIHWTHHNPARNPRHPHGWVDHAGVRYD